MSQQDEIGPRLLWSQKYSRLFVTYHLLSCSDCAKENEIRNDLPNQRGIARSICLARRGCKESPLGSESALLGSVTRGHCPKWESAYRTGASDTFTLSISSPSNPSGVWMEYPSREKMSATPIMGFPSPRSAHSDAHRSSPGACQPK